MQSVIWELSHQNVEVKLGQVDATFGLTKGEKLAGAFKEKFFKLGKLSLAAVPIRECHQNGMDINSFIIFITLAQGPILYNFPLQYQVQFLNIQSEVRLINALRHTRPKVFFTTVTRDH
jgi:hypothetical protein